jgi:hypothetical protein
MEKESFNFLMGVSMKGNFKKMKYMGKVNPIKLNLKVFLIGLMAEVTMDNGKQIKCTGKVFINGVTEESMRAIMKKE